MVDLKKGVTATHPEYDSRFGQWTRCRDACEGSDAVKSKGSDYLPKLSGQTDAEYAAYLKRAMFFNGTERTVYGLAGAVFRKDPELDVPQDIEDLNSVGPGGETLSQTCYAALQEVLKTGRAGLFVDAPQEGEALGKNPPPYLSVLPPESVVNWRTEVIEGLPKLTLVVIVEDFEDGGDEFAPKLGKQYRVLRLLDGVYTVQIYRKKEQTSPGARLDEEWQAIGDPITPRAWGGRPFDFIPFTFVSPSGVEACPTKSPILDLVDVNLSHFLTAADLAHGEHFTALPQAWASGFDPKKGAELTIGSARAWLAKDPDARFGYMEFSGAGLARLSDSLIEKRNMMAVLGSRMLEDQKRAAETAEAQKIRQSGEGSVLANIADAVGLALSIALTWLAQWRATAAPDCVVHLNKDFAQLEIDPQVMANMMAGVQGGLLSYQTWFKFLQDGGIIPAELTEDDERKLILLGPPMGLPPAAAPADPNAPAGA